MYAKDHCDAAISMDADLQDDIHAIDEMVDKFNHGIDVVYGVRSSRKKDTFFKKFTAEGFYKIMKWMGVDICLLYTSAGCPFDSMIRCVGWTCD